VHFGGALSAETSSGLVSFAQDLAKQVGSRVRIVGITSATEPADLPGIAAYSDEQHRFAAAYGETAVLVRPDGYIGWRGASLHDSGLRAYLKQVFRFQMNAAIGTLPPCADAKVTS